MTDREICRMYREAKDRRAQLQILADLSGMGKAGVIGVLARNGERLPCGEAAKLYRRLDALEKQIRELEREYSALAGALGCRAGGAGEDRGKDGK